MRFLAVHFPHLDLDHFLVQHPDQRENAFVLTLADHERPVVTSVSSVAVRSGITKGMTGADAKSLLPGLQLFDTEISLAKKLLPRFAESCIRFSPLISISYPGHIIINATGCTHLWGSEEAYLHTVRQLFANAGYRTVLSLSNTAAAAVAFSFTGSFAQIIPVANHEKYIRLLPVESLAILSATIERLKKLGLQCCGQLLDIPPASLQRRFGKEVTEALDQIRGSAFSFLKYIEEPDPYVERLPCPDFVNGRPAIEKALDHLLRKLCARLTKEEMAGKVFRFGFLRTDDVKQAIAIGLRKPSNNRLHLQKLLEEKITGLDPGPGICLFMLKASDVQEACNDQHVLWDAGLMRAEKQREELLDRFSQRYGKDSIHQYVYAEQHWPERSIALTTKTVERSSDEAIPLQIRPAVLLKKPVPVIVTAPVPDYPPMLFRYQNQIHRIIKADGPERIEPEWWINAGLHRDYYTVEDQNGSRFWIFREGHYNENKHADWFLHGIFA